MYVGTAICVVTVLVVVIKSREWVREAVAKITNAIIVSSMPIREHYKVTVKYLENNVRKVNVKEMTKTTYVKSMLKKLVENNFRKVNVKEMTRKQRT